MKKIFFFSFLFFICSLLFSQNGIFFINNFSPIEYEGENQIWSITQNSKGLLYFGNNNSILEYDGSKWRKLVSDSNNIIIRSITIDKNDKLYYGGVGDFGFLEAQKNGSFKYKSIKKELDTAFYDFTDVWTIQSSGKNIYFCTNKYLFRYNPDSIPTFKVLRKDTPNFAIFKVRDEIFVVSRKDGTKKIIGDVIVDIPKSKDIIFWSILPYEDDKYLIIGGRNVLSIYSPNASDTSQIITQRQFNEKELQKTISYLRENQLYFGGAYLGNDLYAIGTIKKGIIIIDKFGKIIKIVDKNNGLLSQTVHFLFLDNSKQLWAGLTYGISNVEFNSAFEIFDEKKGFQGSIYYIFRYNGMLYLSTNLGLFYWLDDKFIEIPTVSGKQVFLPTTISYQNDNKNLLVFTTNMGMFKLTNTKVEQLNNNFTTSIVQSKKDSNTIWMIENYFLLEGNLKNDLRDITIINKFDFFPTLIDNYDNESIWMLDENQKPIIFNTSTKKITNFSNNLEIKDVEFYYGYNSNFGFIFSTNNGFYTYNQTNKTFEKQEKLLGGYFSNKTIINYIELTNNKFIVVCQNDKKNKVYLVNKSENTFSCDSISFLRLSDFKSVYADGDSLLWFTTSNTFYSYNLNFKRNFDVTNKVIIRNIGIRDSIIFYGEYSEEFKENSLFTFKYKDNDLRIEFTLPEFENSENNQYSYLLEGWKTKEWSDWTDQNFKELTNLHEGKYIFKAKAKNIYGNESKIAEFHFEILPPWYRTFFAYTLYIISLGLLIWLVVWLYSQKLKKENIRLEQTVKQRTAEINQQNEEIKTQAENLTEINKLLVEKNEEVNQQNEEIKAIAETLQIANEEIKSKNKYITDSINYAQRIQTAVLPSKLQLDNILTNYFILFKPKDIISGDFYWILKIDNILLLVAADCTGHGVPGGFISMLAISLLNEIVRRKEINNPAKVLEEMRKIIKAVLKQKNITDSQDDGLDLVFLAIDFKTDILQYSGAYLPLYIVRNNKIIDIKPIMNPIGIYPYEKPFENKDIQIQKDDMLYIFSDGFKDQLNPNNEHFSTSRFKTLLLEISELETDKQQNLLEKSHTNWKQHKNQTDDILVWGIKWK